MSWNSHLVNTFLRSLFLFSRPKQRSIASLPPFSIPSHMKFYQMTIISLEIFFFLRPRFSNKFLQTRIYWVCLLHFIHYQQFIKRRSYLLNCHLFAFYKKQFLIDFSVNRQIKINISKWKKSSRHLHPIDCHRFYIYRRMCQHSLYKWRNV